MSRPPLPYELSLLAEQDIAAILRETRRRFGRHQGRTYAALIQRSISLLAEAPERLGSRPQEALGQGIRSWHLDVAAGRRGAAAHQLRSARQTLPGGAEALVILRVLHEAIEPARHMRAGPGC